MRLASERTGEDGQVEASAWWKTFEISIKQAISNDMTRQTSIIGRDVSKNNLNSKKSIENANTTASSKMLSSGRRLASIKMTDINLTDMISLSNLGYVFIGLTIYFFITKYVIGWEMLRSLLFLILITLGLSNYYFYQPKIVSIEPIINTQAVEAKVPKDFTLNEIKPKNLVVSSLITIVTTPDLISKANKEEAFISSQDFNTAFKDVSTSHRIVNTPNSKTET